MYVQIACINKQNYVVVNPGSNMTSKRLDPQEMILFLTTIAQQTRCIETEL